MAKDDPALRAALEQALLTTHIRFDYKPSPGAPYDPRGRICLRCGAYGAYAGDEQTCEQAIGHSMEPGMTWKARAEAWLNPDEIDAILKERERRGMPLEW